MSGAFQHLDTETLDPALFQVIRQASQQSYPVLCTELLSGLPDNTTPERSVKGESDARRRRKTRESHPGKRTEANHLAENVLPCTAPSAT